MHLADGALVLVTDGGKALCLRNEGDAQFPDLKLVQKWQSPLPPDRELKSDAPGRVFSSRDGSSRRSSYEETNFHQQAEAQFVGAVAEFLNKLVRSSAPESLVLVAPPRTLGVLRKELDSEVLAIVTAEIAKDLVKHPIAGIEALLRDHSEQPV